MGVNVFVGVFVGVEATQEPKRIDTRPFAEAISWVPSPLKSPTERDAVEL